MYNKTRYYDFSTDNVDYYFFKRKILKENCKKNMYMQETEEEEYYE